MQSEHIDILTEVFCEVLEEVAFMFGEPSSKDELLTNAAKRLHATMTFAGSTYGTLGVAMPAEMCTDLAANILGMDKEDDIPATEAEDALKELLNITCGQFLTAMFGEESVFDFSIPQVTEIDQADWSALMQKPETVGFMVEGVVPAIAYVSFGKADK
jgi:CheY-specific phosphatase CheX